MKTCVILNSRGFHVISTAGFLWFLLSSPHFVHGGSGHPKCEPPVDGLVDFSVGIGHFGTFDDVQHLLTSMVMQGAW